MLQGSHRWMECREVARYAKSLIFLKKPENWILREIFRPLIFKSWLLVIESENCNRMGERKVQISGLQHLI